MSSKEVFHFEAKRYFKIGKAEGSLMPFLLYTVYVLKLEQVKNL